MSAIAINAADLAAPTNAFVAVKTTQITVSASATKTGKDFSSLFNKEESVQIRNNSVEAGGNNKTVKTAQETTEYGKDNTATQQTASCKEAEAVQTIQGQENLQEEQPIVTTNEEATGEQVIIKASLKVSVAAVSIRTNAPAVDDQKWQEDLITECMNAMEALSSLLQRFAEILEVTVDKLEGSYEQLDFSFEDMIDVQKLPQLMLNLGKCEDISQVLCDDIPSQIYTDLKDALSDMFESLQMTAKELTNLVTEDMFLNKAAELDILPKGFLKLITGSEENTQEVPAPEAEEQKVPTFEVTRETETDNDTFTGSQNNESTDLTSDIKTSRDTGSDKTRKTSSNDGFEEFIKGLENAVKVTDTKEIPMVNGQPDVREIVMRVVDAIKVNLSPDKTSIELSLSPQSLGKISLFITSKDGTLTARIATENEVTKQAIESQLEVLKETIAQQGVRVEAIEVSISGFTFADSNNAQKGESESDERKTGAAGRKQVRDGATGAAAEESAERGEPIPEGSTVNFVA
ncbi:MAG: flagellar hook-length control protein FliK [Lachnospiraceae bacterium]|nr:flagellar hook-length control protein FliK [Lachnospiraceae bacterium]